MCLSACVASVSEDPLLEPYAQTICGAQSASVISQYIAVGDVNCGYALSTVSPSGLRTSPRPLLVSLSLSLFLHLLGSLTWFLWGPRCVVLPVWAIVVIAVGGAVVLAAGIAVAVFARRYLARSATTRAAEIKLEQVNLAPLIEPFSASL